MPIFFEGDVTQDMQATRLHIINEGTWYLKADSLGLVLMTPTSDSSPTGDPIPVLRELTEAELEEFPDSPGLPVTRTFIELQNMEIPRTTSIFTPVADIALEIEEALEGLFE